MSKLFSSAAPVALTLAATLFCSAAHAAQQDANATRPQVFATQNLLRRRDSASARADTRAGTAPSWFSSSKSAMTRTARTLTILRTRRQPRRA